MPDVYPLGLPLTGNESANQPKIDAGQTRVEGCPVLSRFQCHEVQMGQAAQLNWQLKTPAGKFVRLVDVAGDSSDSDSEDFDVIGTPDIGVTLRMREITGATPTTDKVYSVDVTVIDEETGEVRSAVLPDKIVRKPGVYLEEWGVFDSQGQMLFSNQCCCFVRAGLFGLSNTSSPVLGPPTIETIRLSLRDSHAADNTLLQNVEFDAAEISQAVTRPILYWNESPPPLRPAMTTITFPFKEIWLKGIQAYLLEIAAHNYRRNHLPYNAGGIAIDDKAKEQQYSVIASQALQDFRTMVLTKKAEINTQLFSGWSGSPYSGMFW